ncbi:MAG: type I DNA topoisomerase, partial [Planctomycetia bacterium]|nr:type I DNA topoisomerase [Planctomycetia bacterium]
MARKSAKATDTDSGPDASAPDKKTKARASTAKPKAAKPKAAKPRAAKPKAGAAERADPEGKGAPTGRSLVIVESPKKARSINKFLGSAFVVKASMGHVRDLPDRKLGLDVLNRYAPTYEIMKGKKETITELKREAAKAGMVYLATDPDREGEAIAWHLQEALGLPDERVRRVMFHEITEKAVKEAFTHVGPIDMDKVNAQQARRFLDRFVGYQLSPLLWKKIARHLSAGRVQSVAVRLIADREKEIRAFVSEEYWKITATVSPAGSAEATDRFEAALTEWKGAKFEASNETDARAVRDALAVSAYAVASVEDVEKLDRADPPFKTSTLQQQGAIRLRFSGKRTMKVAQELYEGIDVDGTGPVGLITYMRTDSLRVSDEAVAAVRARIVSEYGERYLPPRPLRYAAGKQAQEAHEAIRPTDLALSPEAVKSRLSFDQFKLYNLIYRRFVASQMNPAVFAVTNVSVAAGEGVFKAQGKV